MNLRPENLHTQNLQTKNLETENPRENSKENLRADAVDLGTRGIDKFVEVSESSSAAGRAFDESVFDLFVADLGSDTAILEYLISFEALLDIRISRIDRALQGEHGEETRTALLSLQASAAMAGATDLESMARRALAHHPGRPVPREPLVRQLEARADAFRYALAGFKLRRIRPNTGELSAQVGHANHGAGDIGPIPRILTSD